MNAVHVGVMQGRLSRPVGGKIQAFPADSWLEEFRRAREAGLACIEWIYEVPNEDRNPLGSDEGIAELRALSERTGVGVRSVCADYYMEAQLLDEDGASRPEAVAHLKWFLGQAAKLGATYVITPFVDQSSLRTPARIDGAILLLRVLARDAEAARVELHLETDLPPHLFAGLLAAVASPWVKANFDIGNSASLGYDPAMEIPALAPYLGSVHVKDRKRGGATVPLGAGDAKFDIVFRELRRANFGRWFILQAARGREGDETELARRNREFVERCVMETA